jgi:endo-1,4-beta-D-glucanase Y
VRRWGATALGLAGVVSLLSACGASTAAPGASHDGAARRFLSHYALRDGRVVRLDQGGDTVSEGQAYGMLIAAAVGDRTAFARIWRWTKAKLGRPDGLFAWHWAGGRVVDPQAASDADLEIARALLVAGCRFGDPSLRRQGIGVGRAVLTHDTARRGRQLILAAGPWATGSPVTVNPSYLDPALLDALGRLTGDRRFGELADGTAGAIAAVSHPLPPDWATVDDQGAVTPSGPPGRRVPATYGFDAPRAIVWSAVASRAVGRRLAARAWPALKARATGEPLAAVAAAAAATAAGDRSARDRLLARADQLQAASPTYYGTAWAALGRLLLTSDRLSICLSHDPRSTT